MAVNPIPEGYHTVTPYLMFQGVEKVIEFATQAFGATTKFCMRHADGKVGHAEIRIGDSLVMLAEAREPWKPMAAALYLYLPDVDAAYQRALEAGATSVMEPADHFYGDRSAGVIDSAGNHWWIATHVEDVSPEEIQKRAEAHAAKQ